MRFIHNAKITVFLKGEELQDSEKYHEIFLKLIPIDFEKEKLQIDIGEVEGLEGNDITIMSIQISKENHTNIFIKHIKTLLGKDQCETILKQKESRLDEELFFYVRLDKKSSINNEWKLTDSGDCVHIKMSVAAFPKKKEAALEIIKKMFSS
jgi:hypothetical protein